MGHTWSDITRPKSLVESFDDFLEALGELKNETLKLFGINKDKEVCGSHLDCYPWGPEIFCMRPPHASTSEHFWWDGDKHAEWFSRIEKRPEGEYLSYTITEAYI